MPDRGNKYRPRKMKIDPTIPQLKILYELTQDEYSITPNSDLFALEDYGLIEVGTSIKITEKGIKFIVDNDILNLFNY